VYQLAERALTLLRRESSVASPGMTPHFSLLVPRKCFKCNIVTLRKYADGPSRSYRGADKSLARPEMKQATATEGFNVHISYL